MILTQGQRRDAQDKQTIQALDKQSMSAHNQMELLNKELRLLTERQMKLNDDIMSTDWKYEDKWKLLNEM